MPIVNITLIAGRSDEQKIVMFLEVTQALQRTLGVPEDAVKIIINEVPAKHFASGGLAKTGPSRVATPT
jgi:4-oxalocrotonate tautomerase